MAERIVVDPITRIEGHLRVEAKVEGGKIIDAASSGTMIRGIEIIARDRDPRDVWALVQRICGVCTTTHALTSIRAVEEALQIRVPKNAELIRKIMLAVIHIHDHVVHFYHLHAPDWVDVPKALQADPRRTAELAQSISRWPKSTAGYFRDVQDKLKAFVANGQLGIFANAYWGHPAYKLPPEANLMAVAHYLEALDWQKEIVKIHTVFGGKNPHPNYLVGGMASAINIDGDNAINIERFNLVGKLIDEALEFVLEVYLPDLLAIAAFYKDTAAYGGGLGNYLCFGDFSTAPNNDPSGFLLPRGAILNKNLSEVLDVDPRDPQQILEYTDHSWYEKAPKGLHPWEGETNLKYTGPKAPYETLDETGAFDKPYSWIKSPRWKGHAMEVGPLARMLVGYAKKDAPSHALIKDEIDKALQGLGVGVEALFSTLGRTAARGIESKLCALWLKQFFNELIANVKGGDRKTFNQEKWEPSTWPKESKGVGLTEAPRGALGHWVRIKDGKVTNYQCVVPSTWNASPKDLKGQHGAYEASLLGVPMAKADQPVELLRTIHSFDPCLACAAHIIDTESQQTTKVEILR
ncbi:uptake [ni/fe] hydrogenase, large subunit [Heliomicrobium modesticaldum Ice1]|uniref:Uptake [ni/fe] hydrogenase, large subunit n=1 Tax=Heliobacterium modesticaldum (strain ATCC 51547 / Ice1) TaxID=498761 RepID=B0TDW2_HELMI|nr:nickel-dependent hydrogenase large subunit [Heliomicrobium modesticaldum]ABZ82825.1 uptake [ni/fe] hydrogenase, large subunit [Heliomicrobium modesticaldum Ice1]